MGLSRARLGLWLRMAVATALSAVLSSAVVGVALLLVGLPVFGAIRYGVGTLEGVVPVPVATVLVTVITATCLLTVEWSLRTVRRARARSAPAGALAQGVVELASYVLLLASIVVLLAALPYLRGVLPDVVFAIGVLVGFFYLLTAAYAWAAHEWVRSRNGEDERTAGGNWLVLGVFVVGYLSVAWWNGFAVLVVAAVLAVALGAVFAPDRLKRVRDSVERRAAEQEESEPVDPDAVYGITDEVRRFEDRLERIPGPQPALLAGAGTVVGAVVYWAATVGSTDAVAAGVAAVAALVLVGVHVGGAVRNEFTGDAAVLRELEDRLDGACRDDGTTIADGGNEADGGGDAAATTAMPALESIVARLAGQADLPVPEVRLLDDRAPVALTVGYRPISSTLVCSRGLLETLSDRELEAVLAHELAHVANRDAAVLTALSVPGAVAGLSRSRYGYNPVVEPLAVFVRTVSRSLVAFVARGREYAADDGAVAITGDPAGLASALETLDAGLDRRPSTDLRDQQTAAFSIVAPPWEEHRFFDRTRRFVARRLFGTHPPTATRIDRLRSAVNGP